VSWKTLLRLAAVAAAVLLLAKGVVRLDVDAIAFGVLCLVGLALLQFRSGLAGMILLGLVFLLTSVFTLAGAVSNVQDREAWTAILLPAALAAIGVAGVLASVRAITHRRHPEAGGRATRNVAFAALAGFLLLVVAGAVAGAQARKTAASGDLVITTANTAFSTDTLTAKSQHVSVFVTNQDLFWHTFSIEGVAEVAVPVGGHRRATFTASPGTYTYFCRIPGHRDAGMHGTLTVP
jgi:plastocyanin